MIHLKEIKRSLGKILRKSNKILNPKLKQTTKPVKLSRKTIDKLTSLKGI
jgi:hypothetical protein